ncbi:MAG: PIN domain-containing protein [Acidobacteriia bacterium]|nr:PIN domain-containing protein [Terriglobia bacterium]
MTLPGGRSFIDTNILVYAMEPDRSPKKERSKAIMERALSARDGVISFQVVQEFLSVALRKFRPPMSPAEAHSYLERVLMPLCAVFPGEELYYEALSIAEETGWSFYDSLIVSAASVAGCGVILTEDLQHGRRIRGAEIRNPFL